MPIPMPMCMYSWPSTHTDFGAHAVEFVRNLAMQFGAASRQQPQPALKEDRKTEIGMDNISMYILFCMIVLLL